MAARSDDRAKNDSNTDEKDRKTGGSLSGVSLPMPRPTAIETPARATGTPTIRHPDDANLASIMALLERRGLTLGANAVTSLGVAVTSAKASTTATGPPPVLYNTANLPPSPPPVEPQTPRTPTQAAATTHRAQAQPQPQHPQPQPQGRAQSEEKSRLGPLPVPKTVTITMAPDWIQPFDPSQPSVGPLSESAISNIWTLIVLFGPAGTQPQEARLKIQIRLLVVDPAAPLARRTDETDVPIVGLHQRAVLWARPAIGQPAYARFSSAVMFSGSRIAPDDLHLESVVLRPYADENDVHALVFHPAANPHAAAVAAQTANPLAEQAEGALGYFKLLHGKKYYINFTFGQGSTIAQLVGGPAAWRPLGYVVKTPISALGVSTAAMRGFTNFVTNWAQGTELYPPDALERAWMVNPQVGRLHQRPKTIEIGPKTWSGGLVEPHILSGIMASANGRNPGTGPSKSISALAVDPAEAKARLELLSALGVRPLLNKDIEIEQLNDSQSQQPWDDVDQRFLLKSVQLTDDGGPLPGVALPSLDVRRFKPFVRSVPHRDSLRVCFSLSSTQQFLTPDEWPLGQTIHAVEAQARLYTTCDANPSPEHQLLDMSQLRLIPISRVLLSLFNVWNGLPGWVHAARYVDDPDLYVVRIIAQQRGTAVPQKVMDEANEKARQRVGKSQESLLSECLAMAENLLHRLCHRLAWTVDVMKASPIEPMLEPPADVALRVLAADRVFLQAASSFMTLHEQRLIRLLGVDPAALKNFMPPPDNKTKEKKRASIPVQWPHSAQVRKQLEHAGWSYKPTVLERDRMVCATCDAVVSGWHAWNSPWSSHKWSKHPPDWASHVRPFIVMPGSRPISQFALHTPTAAYGEAQQPQTKVLHHASDVKTTKAAVAAPGVGVKAATGPEATEVPMPLSTEGEEKGAQKEKERIQSVQSIAAQARVFGSALSSLGAYQLQQQQQAAAAERAEREPAPRALQQVALQGGAAAAVGVSAPVVAAVPANVAVAMAVEGAAGAIAAAAEAVDAE